MNITTFALLVIVLCGFGAAFILLPLAKAIPVRIDLQWRRDLETQATAGSAMGSPPSFPLPEAALVVALGMLLGGIAIKAYGVTPDGVATCVYLISLLLLAAINVKSALLPDVVVHPTLWAGLIYHALNGNPANNIYGAALGFLVPYVLYVVVRAAKRVEVIGFGDLKTFALAGAWFGMEAIPYVMGGFLVGLIGYAIASRTLARGAHGILPSGPAHLFASIAFIVGTRVF
jgi:hypothetical protein